VLFAGYRVPHPLQNVIEVKIQTKKDSTPQRALGDTLSTLIVDMNSLTERFSVRLTCLKATFLRERRAKLHAPAKKLTFCDATIMLKLWTMFCLLIYTLISND
jgi:hypothetical protein